MTLKPGQTDGGNLLWPILWIPRPRGSSNPNWDKTLTRCSLVHNFFCIYYIAKDAYFFSLNNIRAEEISQNCGGPPNFLIFIPLKFNNFNVDYSIALVIINFVTIYTAINCLILWPSWLMTTCRPSQLNHNANSLIYRSCNIKGHIDYLEISPFEIHMIIF